jgi:hypothetical protein
MSLKLVVALLVTAAFAGCASADEGAPAGSTSQPPVYSEPVKDPSKLCLKGRVQNDEFVPIANASVQINQTSRNVLTDGGGNFALCDLEAGRYVLLAVKLGYEGAAKAVDLNESKDNVILTLVAIAINDGYTDVQPFHIYYRYGYSTVDTTTSRYGVNLTTCGPCTFKYMLDTIPDFLVFEAGWTRNFMPAAGATDQMYHILRKGAPFEAGTDISIGSKGKPFVYTFSNQDLKGKALVKDAAGKYPISGSVYCSGNAPCIEQRIEVRFTQFFGYSAVPDGYSAFPPDSP